MPFQANLPIVVDRVTVLPGDYVFADSSGAVIVPSGSIRSVLQEAEAIAAADEESVREIREEDPRAVIQEGGEDGR